MSMTSIVFALLFYVAGAMFVVTVCARAVQLVSRWPEAKPFPHDRNALDRLERRVCDTVLFRETFYADLWAWLLRISLALGIAAMLARHLRYLVAPSGPTWKAVMLAQTPGLYGGLLFLAGLAGLWIRRLAIARLREKTTSADHALFGAALLTTLLGYANTLGSSDVVAVKSFMLGLLSFHWQPIPQGGLLMAHLWLGAFVLGILPLSTPMTLFGSSEAGSKQEPRAVRVRNVWIGLFGILFLVSGGLAAVTAAPVTAQQDFAGLVQSHQKGDRHAMTVAHPGMLLVHRDEVFHKGERAAATTIERCVTCHVVDPGGQAVGYEDDRHFCKSCHIKLAVAMDCFECHNSKPIPDLRAALEPKTRGPVEPVNGKEP